MLKHSRWKTIAILGVTILVCLAALPSALPKDMFAQLPAWAQRKFQLGYDLTGGSLVQLEVDVADLKRRKLEVLRADIGDLLKNRQIRNTRVAVRDGGVEVTVRDAAAMSRALAVLEPLVRPLAEPPPVNERRRLLVTNVDARPSVWAHPNARLPQPDLTMTITDQTVRLMLTDAALADSVVRARDASARRLGWRQGSLGIEYQLHPLGHDRLLFETLVSVDRLNQMQH